MNAPELPAETIEKFTRVFAAYPELAEVKLFGSRATGKATAHSDIDLATKGIVNDHRLGMLAFNLEDIPIPQKCDLQAYENIASIPLKQHIDTFGITIYKSQILPMFDDITIKGFKSI